LVYDILSYLLVHVFGPGNHDVKIRGFIVCRDTLNQNMIIHFVVCVSVYIHEFFAMEIKEACVNLHYVLYLMVMGVKFPHHLHIDALFIRSVSQNISSKTWD
jgi:hypothetical protein